jgi:hypothetical protein
VAVDRDRMAGAHLEVHVPELGEVGAHDLVGVHKDDLAQGEREQHIQEQDLVRPDYALLLRLRQSRKQRALQWLSTINIDLVCTGRIHIMADNIAAVIMQNILYGCVWFVSKVLQDVGYCGSVSLP